MRGSTMTGLRTARPFLGAAAIAAAWLTASGAAAEDQACQYNDSHFHLTNYIQEGLSASELLQLMDGRVCRSTVFGIPLQQEWSYRESGDFAPVYYLDADAPLYYYSFTDAKIALEYRSLSEKDRARLGEGEPSPAPGPQVTIPTMIDSNAHSPAISSAIASTKLGAPL